MPDTSILTSQMRPKGRDRKEMGRAGSLLALIMAASLGLNGCALVNKMTHNANSDQGAVISQGQRISIVAFEQKLQPSKSLKGVGYYIPPAQPVSAWPMAGGDPTAPIQNAAAAADFKIAWTKSIGEGSKDSTEVLAQPVSDGKLIYTLDGQARVSAFDVNNGNQVWSVDLNPHLKRDKEGFGGGLAVSDGVLYVTSGYRFIAALDAASGQEKWRKALDTQMHSPPTVDATQVYATDVDNEIFAFKKSTGDMVWTYQAISEPARILKSSSPIVADDLVYAPFSSGELVALTSNNGNEVWDQVLSQSSRTNALSDIRDIAGRPVLYNGVIFAASHSGAFQAMDARTGDVKWTLDTDSINTPWVAGDVVFLTSLQGELICVSRESGQVYWLKDLDAGFQKTKKGFFGLGRPKLVGKVPLWTGPFVASDRLVMVNSLGEAVAFNDMTGEKEQSLKLPGAAYISPIAVGDKLFVLTDDAKLVAIR
ncbi:PQQ-like beta-propeller repeat protein [Asticcacaulis sp. EMRT-3]|uniref:PQQ-like beta-propeller repeat protein n=1 Tax=Asticcacaulis sp. EMRT-3 TaxID=3040349 RepID=UPI0024AF3C1B|nr:PQQ-like beta-propeller repeat protein [Asticcacaulis sp. EMRT-3]MDI7774646.1 PQQ-binding-like beta-propeller repeat protein [Asticcacaulis sp. EMRT-3]